MSTRPASTYSADCSTGQSTGCITASGHRGEGAQLALRELRGEGRLRSNLEDREEKLDALRVPGCRHSGPDSTSGA
jgi:hypothetical protein